jgi:hypothetical protein
MYRPERDNFQDQQVKRALREIRFRRYRLHTSIFYTLDMPTTLTKPTPLTYPRESHILTDTRLLLDLKGQSRTGKEFR